MDTTKLKPMDWITLLGTFPIVFVIYPILRITTGTDDLFLKVWFCGFGIFVLFLVALSLSKTAEPFELDRLIRFGRILYGLRPKAFDLVVIILGIHLFRWELSEYKTPLKSKAIRSL